MNAGSSVWTGSKILVFGGVFGTGIANNPGGGIYDPATDAWSPLANITTGVARRHFGTAWTGSKMFIWGGYDGTGSATPQNDGAFYSIVGNTWTAAANAPNPSVARAQNSVLWTGAMALVWGGNTVSEFGAGAATNTGFSVAPSVLVEQPAGTSLTDGVGSSDLGSLLLATTASKTFTVKNTGPSDLTGVTVSISGTNAADFSVTTSPASTLGPAATTTFTVRFAPTSGGSGTRVSALHVASSDVFENPFDVALTGQAFSGVLDVDSDGLNDWAEYKLAGVGFDWQVSNVNQVNSLFANATAAGLFTTTQVQDLNVGTPLIQRNATSGEFTLTFGVENSTNLTTWNPFPMTAPQTLINGQGKLEFRFTVPDSAAFFRLRVE